MKFFYTTGLAILISFQTIAQVSILKPYDKYIDSAFSFIQMERSDATMPWDVVTPDSFRLSIINAMFDDPLMTYDYTQQQADELADLWDRPALLYQFIGKQLDLRFSKEVLPISGSVNHGISNKDLKKLNKYYPQLKDPIMDLLEAIDGVHDAYAVAVNDLTHAEVDIINDELFNLWNGEEIDGQLPLFEYRQLEKEQSERAKYLFNLASLYKIEKGFEAAINLYYRTQLLTAVVDSCELNESLKIKTNFGDIFINLETCGSAMLIINGKDRNEYLLDRSQFVQIIIDQGGNDNYTGDYIATGRNGISVLIDKAGNDVYRSKNFSQGAGFFGHGLLIDHSGDDHYISATQSQGIGAFGSGLIFDLGGNDVYEGNTYVQGVGLTGGYGAVVDFQGNDAYLATGKSVDIIRYADHYLTLSQGMGMGYRPIASGGLGMLVDLHGNDNYVCDIYGQASSYWFAFGGLVDLQGHDNYNAYQYAQGSGIHMGFSALIDHKGRDAYRSNGVSQGCGHDYAFGGILDLEGDDIYVCEGLSQGGGNANAVSILIDVQGNDGYLAKTHNTMGYSDTRRDYGMVGIFLDLGGKDWYGSPWGANNTGWTHSTYGVGIDGSYFTKSKATTKKEETDDSLKIVQNLAGKLEELFVQASAAQIQYMYLVEPARDELVSRGEDAMNYIMTQLWSDHVREIHAMRVLFPRFEELGTKPLIDSLTSGNPRSEARALTFLYWMGRKGFGKDAIPHVMEFTDHENWKLRSSAFNVLAQYKDSSLLDILIKGLDDEHYAVRRNASFGLLKLKHSGATTALTKSLSDPSQQIRYNAEKFLAQLSDSLILDFPETWWKGEEDEVANLHFLNSLIRRDSIFYDLVSVCNSLVEHDDIRFQQKGLQLMDKFGDAGQKAEMLKDRKFEHPLLKGVD